MVYTMIYAFFMVYTLSVPEPHVPVPVLSP
jgi:hypothetical protein